MNSHSYQNQMSYPGHGQTQQVEIETQTLDLNLDGKYPENITRPGDNSVTIQQSQTESDDSAVNSLHYGVEDVPAWYITIFLGIQNYLVIAGTIIIIPSQLSEKLCMQPDDPNLADLISTIFFASGIVTILQSTFGSRLPIVQGGSFNFLIPTLAILSLEEWNCENKENHLTWKDRMREIQGAIIVSSLFQVFIGLFGIVGMIARFITPITISCAIISLGLSLFKAVGDFASSNWPVSISTIILTIIFSQYLGTIKLPIPFTKSLKREGKLRYPVFQVLPLLLSTLIVWFVCFVLTSLEWLPPGDEARTDAKTKILENASWFRVPYPFQWGIPTISAGAVFGMLSGVLAGIVESVGDYWACAGIIGVKPPPVHALNRGIFVEGLGCVIAGIWGTGNGTTSYSENIGSISLTRVGSRRVIQVTGLVMMLFSLFAKFGAIFVSVPRPIVGGVVCVSFSIIVAIGISNLKSVNLSSVRNLFIVGFSTFFALTVSQWVEGNPGKIDLGSPALSQICEVILRTVIFLAMLLGLVLDNTVPGSLKDRGLLDWPGRSPVNSDCNLPEPVVSHDFDVQDETYDLPFGMEYLRNSSWSTWLPISPTFKPDNYFKVLPKRLLRRNKVVDVVA